MYYIEANYLWSEARQNKKEELQPINHFSEQSSPVHMIELMPISVDAD